jgi:DNA-directed RNA polymerase subunit H (RpoH/RPB5)
MSNRSSLISSIYKSRETMLDLLETQNYNVINYRGFDVNEISTLYETSTLDMLVEKENDEERSKLYVHHYLEGKFTQSKIQNLVDDLFITEEVLTPKDTLFIIIENEPNDSINAAIHHIWEKDGIFVIVESMKRLQFNVLNHAFQPKFRILNDSEVKDVKNNYNIMTDANWPELSRFDPVCKATFIRPGQIFEITRPSKTSMYSYYYRICVSIH